MAKKKKKRAKPKPQAEVKAPARRPKAKPPRSSISYVECLKTPVGNLMHGEDPGTTYADRLKSKLAPEGRGKGKSKCLLWTGGVSGSQGKILFPSGHSVSVHRAAWAMWKGEEPPRLIRQTCGNPLCCAEEHLEEGASLRSHWKRPPAWLDP